jgi:hypothetical protein
VPLCTEHATTLAPDLRPLSVHHRQEHALRFPHMLIIHAVLDHGVSLEDGPTLLTPLAAASRTFMTRPATASMCNSSRAVMLAPGRRMGSTGMCW